MNTLALVTTVSLILGWNPIAPPELRREKPVAKEASITAPVVIKTQVLEGVDKDVRAKIIIPRKLVHAGGAEVARPAAASPAGNAAPRSEDRGSLTPLGTVIAGLALSLAAVSAVFVFRGNRNSKTVALAVLAGAVVLGALGVAQADIIVPGDSRRPPQPKPALPSQQIVIELSDDGETVTLLIAK